MTHTHRRQNRSNHRPFIRCPADIPPPHQPFRAAFLQPALRQSLCAFFAAQPCGWHGKVTGFIGQAQQLLYGQGETFVQPAACVLLERFDSQLFGVDILGISVQVNKAFPGGQCCCAWSLLAQSSQVAPKQHFGDGKYGGVSIVCLEGAHQFVRQVRQSQPDLSGGHPVPGSDAEGRILFFLQGHIPTGYGASVWVGCVSGPAVIEMVD